ncbi:response regulator [Desulfosporosinus nitroreducens]|uniref:response regulator n=1 Tax=Desulfosporosinus nitroreducens TaxID=2018668 RepID=UPI00207D07CF|nr:response regulator [Desulfosporosinus nitroreducens]MCO1600529.1 response regulator [Desulfosporosinus nitroreducens]
MKKALVVEGNEGIRRLLIEVLAEEGYSVDAVTNGLEALERIQKCIPSVVLLDSELPDMGGIEVLTKISNSYPNLPVVLLAYIDETDVKISQKIGLVKYCIIKPFSLTDLIELLNSFEI